MKKLLSSLFFVFCVAYSFAFNGMKIEKRTFKVNASDIYCTEANTTSQNGTVVRCRACSSVSQQRADELADLCLLTGVGQMQ